MTDLAKTLIGAGPTSRGRTSPSTTTSVTNGRSSAPTVEVKALSRTFASDRSEAREALADVNLSVPSGQFLAVIGASGCGKSTLLRLLGGLDEPSSGEITIDGEDPRLVKGQGVVGLVPQTPALLPWKSVADNVAFLDKLGPSKGSRGSSTAVDSATVDLWLERVELENEGELLPHQLSGGMQQRVALARAFAIEPSLLLMDEPFNALDEITRHNMQTLLTDLWRLSNPTVIFVTHSIDEAIKLSDRVVVLSGGPGGIVADIPIELERPRESGIVDTPEFREHAAVVRQALIGANETEEQS